MTIYFDKLTICFSNKEIDASENTKNLRVLGIDDINSIVKMIQSNGFERDINLHGYNIDDMFDDFCKQFKFIEAAGGVVKNNDSQYLIIKRFGIWDLPKGKIEPDETPEEASVREVCEETGLVNITVKSSLPDTFHIYCQKGIWFLKKTYWLSMQTSDNMELIPQIKENISDAIWMTKSESKAAISESYRSLYESLGYLFR